MAVNVRPRVTEAWPPSRFAQHEVGIASVHPQGMSRPAKLRRETFVGNLWLDVEIKTLFFRH
jgi:hypothetical protein